MREQVVTDGQWSEYLAPGCVLLAALPPGATKVLRGAGKHAEVAATRRVWLRVTVPSNAGLRAAQMESTADFELCLS
eukprot:8391992-Lingulodinium_polyedra.AAC.1